MALLGAVVLNWSWLRSSLGPPCTCRPRSRGAVLVRLPVCSGPVAHGGRDVGDICLGSRQQAQRCKMACNIIMTLQYGTSTYRRPRQYQIFSAAKIGQNSPAKHASDASFKPACHSLHQGAQHPICPSHAQRSADQHVSPGERHVGMPRVRAVCPIGCSDAQPVAPACRSRPSPPVTA